MSKEKPYVPSQEEIRKAKSNMTETEWDASKQREKVLESKMSHEELAAKRQKEADLQSAEEKRAFHETPLIKILDNLEYWRNRRKNSEEYLKKARQGGHIKMIAELQREIPYFNENIERLESELKRRKIKE